MERPFQEKENKPTEETLLSALGNVFPLYQHALEIASAYKSEWNFTTSSGWMLKVHDTKKALFYLIPLTEALKISLTLRESKRKIFLQDADLASMQEAIQSAKKYQEGYVLHWEITSTADFQSFEFLIKKLIETRS